jgi:3-isopropylmalate dehydrogenase
MIGSVAMMLEMSFGMEEEAKNVWHAMQSVFTQGYSTPDLSSPDSDLNLISTEGFGDLVATELKKA